ncbi:SDR family oxidoreductase [Leucobacter sp. CSA1]|uniref:SDR family oxidoreductase n=1 Tax=Leucobacter chromiisoli TaxID=2796471 RepID=A0A934Q5X1_9MICO|nr:SDR family oxidoreductase [Leucobacter chromiisoli]MBK0417462.1 SDR family oxidoreductase [Leucobacter chromiisoli]
MLENKIAVVTGAAGLIGRATAEALRREGAVVVGMDRRDAPHACDRFIVAELSDEEAVAAAFARVDAEFGRLDVLCSNAGIAPAEDGSVISTDLSAWEMTVRANLTSMFLVNKHGIPLMLRGGGGSLVNTASMLGSLGSAVPGIAYSATKGGVLALTADIAVEFAKQGLRANTVSPGPVETPLFTELVDEEGRRRRLDFVPTGRFTHAEEVAEAIVFLASDRSSHVNGLDLKIDGGASISFVTAPAAPASPPGP